MFELGAFLFHLPCLGALEGDLVWARLNADLDSRVGDSERITTIFGHWFDDIIFFNLLRESRQDGAPFDGNFSIVNGLFCAVRGLLSNFELHGPCWY